MPVEKGHAIAHGSGGVVGVVVGDLAVDEVDFSVEGVEWSDLSVGEAGGVALGGK